MNKTLDQTSDLTGVERHRLDRLYPPPPFAKAANYTNLNQLPSHVFGDSVNRLYPINTAANTWESCRAFMDKKAALPAPQAAMITARLFAAAEHFSISPHVDELINKQAAATKTDDEAAFATLPDTQFGLVTKTASGEVTRLYPLRNAVEVAAAGEWFAKYASDFTYDDRRTVAAKILTRAAELGVALADGETLAKSAGYGASDKATVVGAIVDRVHLLKLAPRHKEAVDGLTGLAEALQAVPVLTTDHLTKVASVLDEVDRETGLVRRYGQELKRPEEDLFSVTQKVAMEFCDSHVQTTTGNVYETSRLAELKVAQIREWMGEDFADAVAVGGEFVDRDKFATIVPTLPRGDADLLDRMLNHLGVQPIGTDKAAAEAVTLSPTDLQALVG